MFLVTHTQLPLTVMGIKSAPLKEYIPPTLSVVGRYLSPPEFLVLIYFLVVESNLVSFFKSYSCIFNMLSNVRVENNNY